MINKDEIIIELGMFIGTQNYYAYNGLKLTDGVKYLADSCEAYWLLDIICSYQPNLKNEWMQVWILDVKQDSGLVTCENGNKHALVQQFVEFTDFPLPTIKLFLIDGVILLPSEY